jgi:hypothetical protein
MNSKPPVKLKPEVVHKKNLQFERKRNYTTVAAKPVKRRKLLLETSNCIPLHSSYQ